MASSSSSSYAPEEPPFWPPAPHEWRWAAPLELSTHPAEAAAAASPAASPDSGSSGSLSPASGPLRGAARGRRGRLAGGPRQSASQREKLRMRRLAGALHTLRAFLPPALAPAGRPLTKLQTLRLASRYIAHLHRLLGPPPPPPPPAAPHHWPPTTTTPPAAAQPAPSPPPPPPALAAQGLPAELLAWLEGLLSPGEAHD
ncbi:mesoderm posterior protein 1-like [Sphaerodactylus townsendi]|uniref:Uncharacterized protein n=1 Tax=Sphaerodactylus townsendi TaxID=933632 RepID=A0ACB8E551_9SAUR|nr:mesoderm posterior protein 1-like [Sphaerodactylus townsendi]